MDESWAWSVAEGYTFDGVSVPEGPTAESGVAYDEAYDPVLIEAGLVPTPPPPPAPPPPPPPLPPPPPPPPEEVVPVIPPSPVVVLPTVWAGLNPFAYMRDWFIWATQNLVTYSIWCYAQIGNVFWLGDLFRILSDWTSAVAGELYTLTSWYDYVTGRVAELLSWDNIISYLKYYLDAAINAWSWVVNSFWNVWDIADSWWSSTQYTVKAWIAAATQGFDALKAAWSNFWNVTWPVWTGKLDYLTAAWDNFWSVTFPTLVSFSWLTTWWTARVKDVQGLIDSAFIVRDGFWSGWQDWRDKVTEFFTDPEEWLYKSLDRIIERFW